VLNALWLSLVAGISGYGIVAIALRLAPWSAATRFSFWLLVPAVVGAVFVTSSLASLRPAPINHPAYLSTPVTQHSSADLTSRPDRDKKADTHRSPEPAWPAFLSRVDQLITTVASWALLNGGAIVSVWLFGVGLGFGQLAFSLTCLVRLSRRHHALDATPLGHLLESSRCVGGEGVSVIDSQAVQLPTIVGFISPLILLPCGYRKDFDPGHFHLILTHEYAHIVRHDVWTDLFARTVRALFWFNPAVHLALVHMRFERECACDEIAVRARVEDRVNLANALWRVAVYADLAPENLSQPGILGSGSRLVLRIERLLTRASDGITLRPHARRLIVVGALLASVVGALTISPGRSHAIESNYIKIAPMREVRSHHIAVRLNDGMVLIAGGLQGENATTADAELFDPLSRTFRVIASMHSPRYDAAAALLPNGDVLIAGGWIAQQVISKAELYDPRRQIFIPIDPLDRPRGSAQTVPLLDGRVVIIGGQISNEVPLRTAEIFNPFTRRFLPTGSMATPREVFAAVRLKDGRVLVTGGSDGVTVLGSAEVYDPETGKFSSTGRLLTPRMKHSATLLADGRVLITGGVSARFEQHPLRSAEIFLPRENRFVEAPPMNFARFKHDDTTVALRSGDILVAGGAPRAELFDPKSERFKDVQGPLDIPRYFGVATELPDGSILITGGYAEESVQSRSVALFLTRNSRVVPGARPDERGFA
jgi:beta-lactamase regulating signal transducer with metallopeptidase domain